MDIVQLGSAIIMDDPVSTQSQEEEDLIRSLLPAMEAATTDFAAARTVEFRVQLQTCLCLCTH